MQGLNLVPKKRRGNPNWGKFTQAGPAAPTAWDKLCERLAVTEATAAEHPEVRRFVRKHAKTLFIPESVLEACGEAPSFRDDEI